MGFNCDDNIKREVPVGLNGYLFILFVIFPSIVLMSVGAAYLSVLFFDLAEKSLTDSLIQAVIITIFIPLFHLNSFNYDVDEFSLQHRTYKTNSIIRVTKNWYSIKILTRYSESVIHTFLYFKQKKIVQLKKKYFNKKLNC